VSACDGASSPPLFLAVPAEVAGVSSPAACGRLACARQCLVIRSCSPCTTRTSQFRCYHHFRSAVILQMCAHPTIESAGSQLAQVHRKEGPNSARLREHERTQSNSPCFRVVVPVVCPFPSSSAGAAGPASELGGGGKGRRRQERHRRRGGQSGEEEQRRGQGARATDCPPTKPDGRVVAR
jgi:hypothetical protein